MLSTDKKKQIKQGEIPMSETISGSLEEYFKQHYSPKSISNYLGIISRFAAYMNGKAETASYKDILEYIGYLRKSGLSPRSIQLLACCKSLL